MNENSLNLYLSTTFYNDHSRVDDVLRQCSENGIYHIELGSNHVYEDDPIGIVQMYPGCYLVHNYFPTPKDGFVVNIASLNDVIHNRSMKHIFRSIDFCDAIQAKLYTFHPGFVTDPGESTSHAANYDFQFKYDQLKKDQYDKTFERMLNAVKDIVAYAHKKGVLVAIETEGSVSHKGHLLMQHPDEFSKFFAIFSPDDIGINLNIGHLRLASRAFGFETDSLINLISEYVVAMELSHNGGNHDEHLTLVEGEWYWRIIFDERFIDTYKILEIRNTSIEKVLLNRKLIQRKFDEQLGLVT